MDGYRILKESLSELANDIKEEVLRRLRSNIGINPRTGTNTLVGSDLEASIDVKVQGDGLVFQIASHWEYVVLGWRHTGNFSGTKQQFLKNLLEWCRRKGVIFPNHTENETVYLIYRSINERLIAPRPFINYDPSGDPSLILPFLNDYFDKFADDIFNKVVAELDESF